MTDESAKEVGEMTEGSNMDALQASPRSTSHDRQHSATDPLEIYLGEIKKNPILTRAEELRWARRFDKARQRITIRKNKTKRFFKTVAPQWEGLKKEVLGTFDLNRVLTEKIRSRNAVADLGCGTGELLERLYPDTDKLIGVDSSPDMLEQSRMKLSGAGAVEREVGRCRKLWRRQFLQQ